MLYSGIDLGHQAITWTDIDLSSVMSRCIHLGYYHKKI